MSVETLLNDTYSFNNFMYVSNIFELYSNLKHLTRNLDLYIVKEYMNKYSMQLNSFTCPAAYLLGSSTLKLLMSI